MTINNLLIDKPNNIIYLHKNGYNLTDKDYQHCISSSLEVFYYFRHSYKLNFDIKINVIHLLLFKPLSNKDIKIIVKLKRETNNDDEFYHYINVAYKRIDND